LGDWIWGGSQVKTLKMFESLGLGASFDKGNAIQKQKGKEKER